ncbi:MAG: ABC transporter permease [Dysgonamonadaceae bacterium]|jgi:ABC-type antimicrobial peptide transport system permease subunit|nr:ABC transporter permease [Dysgonamonadaceae bacterium]
MFYNLKIAIRNLRRNGLYSVINIIGLTVSLATCILITLWVYDEWSYDRFHANKENIYLVNTSVSNEGFFDHTPGALSVYGKEEIPVIKDYCRISWFSFNYLRYNDRQVLIDNSINRGAAVDSSFFRMFTFPLIEGDIQKPFAGDNSIIFSESMAKSVFGDENPMGRAVRTNWSDEYFYVTGIMEDMPKNSTLQYDYIVPMNFMKRHWVSYFVPGKTLDEDFGEFRFSTYLELYPGSHTDEIEEQIVNIVGREMAPYASMFGPAGLPPFNISLQQITDQHLYNPDGTPGGMAKIRLFAVIAGLILVIACINYVNLVTARIGKRSKEMGIRKFLGANWIKIVRQAMQETCVMLFISIVLATVLIYVVMPVYNQISGKNMEFSLFSFHAAIIYGVTLFCVLVLAGLYPSLFLASSNSSKHTKNKGMHVVFRKALVVVQFVCSIVLIVSTLVITLQMNFIRKKDLGYDKENVICFPAWGMGNNKEAVRNELQKNPDITGVATADFENMITHNFTYGVTWQGSDIATRFSMGWFDFDFFDVMNIRLTDGAFPLEASADKYCLLNETAVREMQLQEDPLNQIINFNNQSYTVSGIVRDFHFESLSQPILPMILICSKANYNNFYIRTTTQGTKSALASIETMWKKYCPNLIFSYSFLDENFERLYEADIQMGKLLYIFAFIAIMISCLGLFGLVTFTAETKTKEIGIRKVLGASVGNIINMLSKEFLILVGIAMLIAFPLAYYWLNNMLQDYAYRISIGWWIFVLAGLITIVLTLLTVGFQALKAATANPVKSIKTE